MYWNPERAIPLVIQHSVRFGDDFPSELPSTAIWVLMKLRPRDTACSAAGTSQTAHKKQTGAWESAGGRTCWCYMVHGFLWRDCNGRTQNFKTNFPGL